MPELGQIVYPPKYICNRLNGIEPVKHIVTSFPLCENARPYSIGIHTCTIKNLKNGKTHKVSGFYFVDFNI
jgi:hypothetical protein